MNMQQPPEIPNLKLAKVGKDRKRRGGAALLVKGGAGGGGSMAGMLGAHAGRSLLLMAISGMSAAGAWSLGAAMKTENLSKPVAPKFGAANPSAQKYDDLSGVIRSEKTIPNSMGYVSGSVDGLTPEERAKKQAEDEAARKAAEEQAAKAEAEANAQPQDPAGASPDVMAAQNIGTTKGALGSGRFGKLSNAMAGGGSKLSGGAGLSGGIGQGFKAPSGGAAPRGGQSGSLSSFRKSGRPALARAASGRAKPSNTKGFAKRQLFNAFAQRPTSMGRTESMAEQAGAGFENNAGQGAVIGGAGVGTGIQQGAGGVTDGGTPTTDPGGPIGSGCGDGQAPNSSGGCSAIATPQSANATPYQGLVDMAKGIMMMVTVISVLALLAQHLKESSIPYVAQAALAIENMLNAVLYMAGIALVGIGAMIAMQYGEKSIGMIVGAVGGLTIASAYFAKEKLISQTPMVNAAAGALISNVVGQLALSSQSKPSSWQ